MASFAVKLFKWCGVYVSTDSYTPMDLVRYAGAVYINKAACTGALPTDTTKWDLFLKDGDSVARAG